jgi:hypothetical protein
VHYAVQIYPSCHYCNTPAGVDLYRFDDAGAEEWLGGVPEAPFIPYDPEAPTAAQLAIPVLEPRVLAEAITGEQREDADYNGVGAEDFREVTEEDIRFALPAAVWKTLNEWRRIGEANPS